jgi:probable rRNA maturation factor
MMVADSDGRATVMNRQRAVTLGMAPLRAFLQRVREELQLQASGLTICFVTDAEIARMNEAFRKKHGPTDVLSFPAQVHRGKPRKLRALRTAKAHQARGEKYLGDIAISPAAARRNAKEYGRNLPAELRILMLHGVLHLLGYDHETDDGKMNRLETKLRRRFGLA